MATIEKEWKKRVEKLKSQVTKILYGGNADMGLLFEAVTEFGEFATIHEQTLGKSKTVRTVADAYAKLFGGNSNDLENISKKELGNRLIELNSALDKILSKIYENEKKANISNQKIIIKDSTGIQIGNYNQLEITLKTIYKQIDSSTASKEEKETAKSKLDEFLSHPLVTSIIGGLSGGISS